MCVRACVRVCVCARVCVREERKDAERRPSGAHDRAGASNCARCRRRLQLRPPPPPPPPPPPGGGWQLPPAPRARSRRPRARGGFRGLRTVKPWASTKLGTNTRAWAFCDLPRRIACAGRERGAPRTVCFSARRAVRAAAAAAAPAPAARPYLTRASRSAPKPRAPVPRPRPARPQTPPRLLGGADGRVGDGPDVAGRRKHRVHALAGLDGDVDVAADRRRQHDLQGLRGLGPRARVGDRQAGGSNGARPAAATRRAPGPRSRQQEREHRPLPAL
jgi:hypothetical protein